MLLLIGVFVVLIANIILGIFVYINNPSKLSNKAFALMCMGLSSWAAFNYLADYQLPNTLIWSRLSFFAIIYALAFLSIFLNNFPNRVIRTKLFGILTIIIATIVAVVSLSPGFIPAVSIQGQVSNVQTGPLYLVFLIYFAIYLIIPLLLISISWRKSTGQDKARVAILVSGILAMTVFASITNLILPLILGNNNFAKYGTLFSLIYVGLTAYAIIKHSLFDIRAVVVRSFAYVFSIITIAAVYAYIAFGLIGRYLFPKDQQVSIQQQLFNTMLAVILAFTFQPIRRFFEKVSNKIFYRDRYDSQAVIDDIGHVMASEIRISQLCNKVTAEVVKKLKVSKVDVIVFENDSILYSTKNINKYYTQNSKKIIKLGAKLNYIDEISNPERIELMKDLKISLSVPLKTSNGFIGYLLLSEKQSGEIYNEDDIKTVKIVANELSVALENAKAFMEISKFNETLQDKVDKATRSLRKANSQLKELDEAKDEFISMASHQLRTPLTTVKGYVSMLDEGDFGELTKDQKNSVDLALDGSNRMARLIDDLLNVSRMEAGKFYIDATKVDLEKMVEQEVALLNTLADTKKVKVLFEKPKTNLPKMHLDDNKTRQVVMNLVDNAIHYSQPPKGGGRVTVNLHLAGDSIEFKVVDNGIGVPKDQQGKLFTKMFRAKNAKEVRPDGTGLGLYLVKRVVEDQGGKVIFESKPGKGSTFGFKMPIHNSIKVDEKAKNKLSQAQK
jgi:signal transduction histidine kinase